MYNYKQSSKNILKVFYSKELNSIKYLQYSSTLKALYNLNYVESVVKPQSPKFKIMQLVQEKG